jgi:hypothetical protein
MVQWAVFAVERASSMPETITAIAVRSQASAVRSC